MLIAAETKAFCQSCVVMTNKDSSVTRITPISMDFQAGAPGHLSDLGQRRSTISGWEAEANSMISGD